MHVCQDGQVEKIMSLAAHRISGRCIKIKTFEHYRHTICAAIDIHVVYLFCKTATQIQHCILQNGKQLQTLIWSRNKLWVMVKLWSYDCDNWSVSNKCIRSSSQGCHTVTGTHMPHGITQCYLPPSRGDIPALTPAEAGTWLSDPGGMQGWVDLVGLLHTEMVYPPEDGHPSRY